MEPGLGDKIAYILYKHYGKWQDEELVEELQELLANGEK